MKELAKFLEFSKSIDHSLGWECDDPNCNGPASAISCKCEICSVIESYCFNLGMIVLKQDRHLFDIEESKTKLEKIQDTIDMFQAQANWIINQEYIPLGSQLTLPNSFINWRVIKR